jgi:Flp pilus assembly protein TadD/mono/diheme cytochrome c family protein
MRALVFVRRTLGALAMFGLAGFVAQKAAAQFPANAPTYNKDIATIMDDNCVSCHRAGGAGPFSLASYPDVKKRARQIAEVTASRYMPPWLPEPGFGKFLGERMLSDRQLHLIQQWAAAGAPEGNSTHPPPVPKAPEEWQLGKPDLIVQLPQPYVLLPGGNTESWPRFVLPTGVAGTHYVKAIEIHPGDPKIVHHCYIVTDRTQMLHNENGEAFDMGSTGMEKQLASSGAELDSRFLTWRPGTPPYFEPEGATWRLDKDTDLTLTLHLLSPGKPEAIQPSVGFYFSDQAPTKFPMILHLEHDNNLDIPAGARGQVVSDDLRLPVDVKVLSVLPHAHYLCRDMKAYATLPDGTRRWLIWIKRWNFDWQGVFRFEEPVALPKGTIVSMRYTYDNTAENPRNPNTPPKRVIGGPKSTDEMADLWLEVLPDRRADLYELEIAQMQSKLAKYPHDLEGYADLGAALHAMGRNHEALIPLREAAILNPEDVQVQNNLGTVLGSLGDLDEAIQHLRAALAIRPEYFLACMNLASALRLQGNLEEAATYLREAERLKPDSAETHDKLGMVYEQQGRIGDAVAEFQNALRLRPDDAVARDNLARARAIGERVN